ncbi:FAD/NAD(P)-binding protein [Streptacidiphilus sp. N1-12]|uniref:FAD/NAD(P)-binding protein n=2 Tax=Streptacidiphilus alkalitolerans TaxID=3342712 RepID=A0ABV6WN12_9ACTN
MPSGYLQVCIVGAGPRGLSVLERLCANARLHSDGRAPMTIHLVDPFRPGPGQVWRSSQSRQLLMNTVSSQVTAFTDDSVEMAGPVEPGPSLYEWARSAPPLDEDFRSEADRLGPDDYPTRALYGRYLEHVFDRVVSGAPRQVTVQVHSTLAVGLHEEFGPDRTQILTLADGTRLTGLDAIVLAQGHVPARPTERQAELARTADAHGLTYLLPANPADLDLSAVKPGEALLLRGLGLNFFDHMALLTVGRGGEFTREDGRLVYLPSGQEPKMYAGSRRGIPYHARGDNQKGAHGRHHPRLLTPQLIAELRARAAAGGHVYFGSDLWPLIAREVESVYYGALLAVQGRGDEQPSFTEAFLTITQNASAEALLDRYGISADQRWNWDRIALPHGGAEFADREEFRGWLLHYLAEDVREARAGNVSGPVKAALDVLRDLRNELRLAVDHGGLEGNSYRDELQGWYTPLNAFVSIGPPASRIEELMALLEAGVVELVGPGMRVRIDPDGPAFTAESPSVGGEPVRATALIEARLPEPDLRRTADPLLEQLLRTARCRTHRIAVGQGAEYETGGLAVTGRPYRVIDGEGQVHPRLFAYGVPTETVHWVTAAGIRPGVNSVTLGDSDAIARAILSSVPSGAPRRDEQPHTDLKGAMI